MPFVEIKLLENTTELSAVMDVKVGLLFLAFLYLKLFVSQYLLVRLSKGNFYDQKSLSLSTYFSSIATHAVHFYIKRHFWNYTVVDLVLTIPSDFLLTFC